MVVNKTSSRRRKSLCSPGDVRPDRGRMVLEIVQDLGNRNFYRRFQTEVGASPENSWKRVPRRRSRGGIQLERRFNCPQIQCRTYPGRMTGCCDPSAKESDLEDAADLTNHTRGEKECEKCSS
uniref:Nonribosomal peptide synthetase 6 n=1 Tax=Lygus hesperus TaxID=30085 RepID=A0A0A9WML5_LYGHE